jgi:hypothetical protein
MGNITLFILKLVSMTMFQGHSVINVLQSLVAPPKQRPVEAPDRAFRERRQERPGALIFQLWPIFGAPKRLFIIFCNLE